MDTHKTRSALIATFIIFTLATSTVARIAERIEYDNEIFREFSRITEAKRMEQSPNVLAKPLAVDYLNFGIGAALGAVVELSINMSNNCVSTIASSFQSVYLMIYYMK